LFGGSSQPPVTFAFGSGIHTHVNPRPVQGLRSVVRMVDLQVRTVDAEFDAALVSTA
jgi:hypothetical protein